MVASAFNAEHDIKTTPQMFIDGMRIGGYDDPRRYFELKFRDPKVLTCAPVLAVFPEPGPDRAHVGRVRVKRRCRV